MERIKKIHVDQIPDLDYEGYYWLSNAQKPVIVDGEKINTSVFTRLPFVVEANFYSGEEKISVRVKNIDGEYHAAVFDLKGLNENEVSRQQYIGHDLEGRNFEMTEIWKEKNFAELEDMPVLVPEWTVFTGFVNTKK